MKVIRVLVVDDSALVREILSKGLQSASGIEVVGTAADPFLARDMIVKLNPDVITLDVEMPRMDGVEFLRRLMPHMPKPVVMVSSLTPKGSQVTMDALEAGAVDYVTKPTGDLGRCLPLLLSELATKIKIASTANVSAWKHRKALPKTSVATPKVLSGTTDKVIAIGTSTGGTEALVEVLKGLPVTCPGIVVVQHMPPKFTKMFADRLNGICQMTVKEAQTGDRVMQGRILIAPGGLQMRIIRHGGIYKVICKGTELVNGHCPSVEPLFDSVAKHVGGNAVGVMLTGMGRDGADAMLRMRRAGARTVGQDEATSVVFGMPKAAFDVGAVETQLPIQNISTKMIQFVNSGSITGGKAKHVREESS